MNGIGRIGFMQRMTEIKEQVLSSQGSYVKDSLKLNSGNRLLSISEDPEAVKKISSYSGDLVEAQEQAGVKKSISSLLEISESAISSIKDILDDIHNDALSASNTTTNATDRVTYANLVKTSTENIYRLANSKINGQFLFSGKQSDKKTIDFNPNDIFFQSKYLEGKADQGVKDIYGLNSSVTLDTLFNSQAKSATISSNSPANPSITSTSDIRLIIEDGTGKVFDTGNISLPAGTAMFPPALPNVISIINAAANAVGVQGSIAQESPAGFLKFDTSLITGSKNNQSASITLSNGTTSGSALSDFKITAQKAQGTSQNLQDALHELYKAYLANDVAGIKVATIDIEANITRAIDKQTLAGTIKNTIDNSRISDEDQADSIKLQKSTLEDIPSAEALVSVNKSKLVLDSVLRNANSLSSANIFNFLSF